MDAQSSSWDVVICGGGLSGLTLARQVRLQIPQLSVLVIEATPAPLPTAAFKVGESTTEAGAHYLAETLRLRDYLAEHHLYKLGFRFFFDGLQPSFDQRPEFGLSDFPIVTSFNVDRGILETDLRRFNTNQGIETLEGYVVREITLGAGRKPHQVLAQKKADGEVIRLDARWLIDATGRRRLIQRKLNLIKRFGKNFGAAWFRVEGRVDVTELVPPEKSEWHERVKGGKRYYSTNHLMGYGYWVWIIPLPSNATSVGIVAMEEIHPVKSFNSFPTALRWLEKYEHAFAKHLSSRQIIDFMWMRNYSYSSRQVFSLDRWACVGDAAVFSDPLYASATDLIGIGNSMVAEMIRLDLIGKLRLSTVNNFNWSFIGLNEALTRNIQIGYPLFRNPMVTTAKIMWDTAAGWALLAPQIFNSIFIDDERSAKVRKAKAGYFLLAQCIHRLFVDWEALSAGRGRFTFIDFLKIPLLLELRQRNLKTGKTEQELVDDHRYNMDRLEELAQVIFLLALQDVMPERTTEFERYAWLNAWGISLDPEKWSSDRLFQPTTPARDITDMRNQFRALFNLESHPAPAAEAQLSSLCCEGQ